MLELASLSVSYLLSRECRGFHVLPRYASDPKNLLIHYLRLDTPFTPSSPQVMQSWISLQWHYVVLNQVADAPPLGDAEVEVGVAAEAGADVEAEALSTSFDCGRSPLRIQRSISGCMGSVSLSESRPKILPTLTKCTKDVLSSRWQPRCQKSSQCDQYRWA